MIFHHENAKRAVVIPKYDNIPVTIIRNNMKTLDEIKKFMNNKPIIVDVRGIFNEEEAKRKGFYYNLIFPHPINRSSYDIFKYPSLLMDK